MNALIVTLVLATLTTGLSLKSAVNGALENGSFVRVAVPMSLTVVAGFVTFYAAVTIVVMTLPH